ncbi:MAG TPA: acylneuraminate cytidylyltransferase family protein [Alphaproteobacteria bacterium]|nr:acylneuraminate cytidylyltransferase family protein [Alphaproteobacteria bacterium]
MTLLAFIPARGGSKGIPRKNMALLAGRPLLGYTLAAAKASRAVSEIFVSTDDDEIAAFSEAEGVAVPYRRPKALATDTAPIIDAVVDALDWRMRAGLSEPAAIALLQPTSPFRAAADIDRAAAEFEASGRESLVAVHEMAEHPYECVRASGEGWSPLATPPTPATRRQDYGPERFLFINGALYIATPRFLRRRHAFVVPGETALFEMDPVRGADIDDLDDWHRAEALLASPALKGRLALA